MFSFPSPNALPLCPMPLPPVAFLTQLLSHFIYTAFLIRVHPYSLYLHCLSGHWRRLCLHYGWEISGATFFWKPLLKFLSPLTPSLHTWFIFICLHHCTGLLWGPQRANDRTETQPHSSRGLLSVQRISLTVNKQTVSMSTFPFDRLLHWLFVISQKQTLFSASYYKSVGVSRAQCLEPLSLSYPLIFCVTWD